MSRAWLKHGPEQCTECVSFMENLHFIGVVFFVPVENALISGCFNLVICFADCKKNPYKIVGVSLQIY